MRLRHHHQNVHKWDTVSMRENIFSFFMDCSYRELIRKFQNHRNELLCSNPNVIFTFISSATHMNSTPIHTLFSIPPTEVSITKREWLGGYQITKRSSVQLAYLDPHERANIIIPMRGNFPITMRAFYIISPVIPHLRARETGVWNNWVFRFRFF